MIKYDQLYFVVPSFYLYLKEKEIKASGANTKCVNCTNLETTSIECATECATLVNASSGVTSTTAKMRFAWKYFLG